uniref:Serine/threonine-protein kinase BSK1-like TPR repeats domain-containing protein n=1 Tax=Leersia perrieri TaxID=77586 RepID=A0A0D9UXF0_9ORYZ
MAAPFVYLRPTDDGTSATALRRAAFDGNLGRLKDIIKDLGFGKRKTRNAVLAFDKDGIGLLLAAACQGHLNVCKYLVEEFGADMNAAAVGGVTPFMASAESGDVPTVEYFLDHGGDITKVDDKGCAVLHHAAGTGCCKVTEFLLSKGVPVDMDCGRGTPLFHAANNGKDKTLKILLDHHADAGADVNGKGTIVSPLMLAASQGGYTSFIKFLLKAGANPNVPDDLGWLPIEYAASRDCREEVEMLFPFTSPIPNVLNWSVDGIISHAKVKDKRPMDQNQKDSRKSILKAQADLAFRQKMYDCAAKVYSLAIDHGPTAVLYANRSICRLLTGDGEGALSDAHRCRMMRPKWAKACYRQGVAHILLKEYKHACDALMDAQKMDPESFEIERELRKAREFMGKTSR